MPRGWRLTGVISALLALALLAIVATSGGTEDGLRLAVRASARASVTLFSLAFAASSLHDLLRRDWTGWLLRNRRYLGVSFAVSHLYHLIALGAIATLYPHPFLDRIGIVTLAGGGLAYLFIFTMAATSFDRAVRWLGARRWKLLHTTGGWYVWIVFAQSYLPRSLRDATLAPFFALLLAVLALRLIRAVRRRHARA